MSRRAASLMYSDAATYNYSKIKTNDDRLNFLNQFGWAAESTPIEEEEVTIPGEFDKVFVSYNELQKPARGLISQNINGKMLQDIPIR